MRKKLEYERCCWRLQTKQLETLPTTNQNKWLQAFFTNVLGRRFSMSRKWIRVAMVVGVLVVGSAYGYDQAKGVLFPQFTPEKGSYEKPAAQLGEKPDNAWSATTVAAAVDAKPLPGKVVTIKGEIVDYSCYLQLGKHGGKHRDCGQKCLKAGMPIGLLTQDGTLYLLMEEEHNLRRDKQTNFRDTAIENMAYVVEVAGTLSEVDGQRGIFVTGFLKNK
jgi:hypothetical protein